MNALHQVKNTNTDTKLSWNMHLIVNHNNDWTTKHYGQIRLKEVSITRPYHFLRNSSLAERWSGLLGDFIESRRFYHLCYILTLPLNLQFGSKWLCHLHKHQHPMFNWFKKSATEYLRKKPGVQVVQTSAVTTASDTDPGSQMAFLHWWNVPKNFIITKTKVT